MRTGLVAITLALGCAGLGLAGPPRAHAACKACNDAVSANHSGGVARRTFSRSRHIKLDRGLPVYGVVVPGCFWRKMRLWNPDGQYVLVSRIQFCR